MSLVPTPALDRDLRSVYAALLPRTPYNKPLEAHDNRNKVDKRVEFISCAQRKRKLEIIIENAKDGTVSQWRHLVLVGV